MAEGDEEEVRPALQWVEETIGLGQSGQSADLVYSAVDGQGAEWSTLRNLVFCDGAYQTCWRQFGTQPDDYTIEFNTPATSGLTNAQKVKWIYRSPEDLENDPEILVTTREIFVRNNVGAYVNVTPLYTEGTSACAGLTAVTGVGTLWVTHRIKPGMLIRWPSVSTTWFMISLVNTNTSITLTGNGPNTAGQVPYEIRRCFGGDAKLENDHDDRNRIFCHVRNGDLYIAGNTLDGQFPAVIQVVDVLGNATPLPADSTYILAQAALTTGHPATAIVSTLHRVLGMQLADDGRVVLAMWETKAGGGLVRNRARWNKPTLMNDWTGDGASFTDIPGASDPRSLTGLGRAGDTLSFHFADGITLGRPTGQLSNPYDFSTSIGGAGAACPEVLCTLASGDIFLDSSLGLFVFNGGTIDPISRTLHDEVSRFLSGIDVIPGNPNDAPSVKTLESAAMCFDTGLNAVHLFLNWDSAPHLIWGCRHLTFDFQAGRLTTADWPVPVTAATGSIKAERIFAAGFPSAYHRANGLASADLVRYCGPTPPGTMAFDAAVPSWDLPLLRTGQPTVIPTTARTGWLDYRAPGQMKTTRVIEIWALRPGASLTTTLTLSVESLPTNLNQQGPLDGYPPPAELTVSLRDYNAVGMPERPTTPMVNVARANIDPSYTGTPPNAQSISGESLRYGVSGLPQGFLKMVVRATLDGPLAAIDAEG